jgi:uncharacterized membrane protein
VATHDDTDSRPARALHPPLVHAPIGGVVIAALCDLISLAGGSSYGWAHSWFKGGSYALTVGTGGMLVAGVAGFVDRARHSVGGSGERRAVNRHAAVMTLMTVVSVVDVLLRIAAYDAARHTPVVVLVMTLMALALAAAGGELGGRLVYRAGIGVAPPAPGSMTARPMEKPAATRSWRVSLALTLAAWMAAFAIVTALLLVFGHQLAALPLAVRALLISGVVVIAMTRLVQPALSAAAARWVAAPRRQDSNARRTEAA